MRLSEIRYELFEKRTAQNLANELARESEKALGPLAWLYRPELLWTGRTRPEDLYAVARFSAAGEFQGYEFPKEPKPA